MFFSISSEELSQATGWIIEAPTNANVIVNIPGGSNSISSMQMSLGQGMVNNTVLLNFYETTSLVVTATSVKGSILAPLATVNFTNGNIDGNLYCVNVFGDGEIHLAPPIPIRINCPPCNC